VKVVVTGYAGLDHVMRVAALPRTNQTAIVEGRLSHAWPRQGGCAPNVARGLAAAQITTELVSWLGDEPEGERYLLDLRADGVGTRGVSVREGEHTASTYLFYAADGGSMCFYYPGGVRSLGLSEEQQRLVVESDWLCVTVGPRGVSEDLLEAVPDGVKIVWSVKADPDAFPPVVVRGLLARSVAVVFSQGERQFLEQSVAPVDPLSLVTDGALLVETKGESGVSVLAGEDEHYYPVEPVPVADPTGAGDAFVAGMLARLVRRPEDHDGAVLGGIEAARRFVDNRAREYVEQ
jgi:sugar/nucleoside kinase (ribokinase family)